MNNITIIIFVLSYILGLLLGILIIELRDKFIDWNREKWGVPKE